MGFSSLNYVSTACFPGQIQCSASLEIVNGNHGRVLSLTLKQHLMWGINGSLGLRLYPHEAPLPEVAKVLLERRTHSTPGILACLGYFALAPPSFPHPSLQYRGLNPGLRNAVISLQWSYSLVPILTCYQSCGSRGRHANPLGEVSL